MKKYSIYLLSALCTLLTACNSDDPLSNGGNDSVTPAFALSTRAEGDAEEGQTTYRLLAYSSAGTYLGDTRTSGGKTYNYGTGTYYLSAAAAEGTALTPCTVNDDGSIEDMSGENEDINQSPAIHGSLGNVLIACVSPAVKNNTDGTIPFEPQNKFLCSLAEEVNVTGYGTVKLNNPLLDRRAKIVIKIYKGAEAQVGFTIPAGSITLEGMGGENDRISFNPVNRSITVPAGSETAERTMQIEAADGSTGTDGNTFLYRMNEYFVPAADYSVQGSPQLIAHLGVKREGSDKVVYLPVPLTSPNTITEFTPETVYTYNIVLSSVHYSLIVGIEPWTPEDSDAEVDDTYGETINLGNFSYGEGSGGWTEIPDDPNNPPIGG